MGKINREDFSELMKKLSERYSKDANYGWLEFEKDAKELLSSVKEKNARYFTK